MYFTQDCIRSCTCWWKLGDQFQVPGSFVANDLLTFDNVSRISIYIAIVLIIQRRRTKNFKLTNAT